MFLPNSKLKCLKGVQIFNYGVLFISNLLEYYKPCSVFPLPYIVPWYHSKNIVRFFQVMNYLHWFLHDGSKVGYPVDMENWFSTILCDFMCLPLFKPFYKVDVPFILKYVTQSRIMCAIERINHFSRLEIGMYSIISNL